MDILRRDSEKTELFQFTGVSQTMLSNRISYFYDLKGPSVTVDTGMIVDLVIRILHLIDFVACSSSLVALHLACSAIRAGDVRMAIVGGSNLILTHEPTVELSMLRYADPESLTAFGSNADSEGFSPPMGAVTHTMTEPTVTAVEKERPVSSSNTLRMR